MVRTELIQGELPERVGRRPAALMGQIAGKPVCRTGQILFQVRAGRVVIAGMGR